LSLSYAQSYPHYPQAITVENRLEKWIFDCDILGSLWYNVKKSEEEIWFMSSIIDQAKKAKEASYTMFSLSSETKNQALLSIANALQERKLDIFEANDEDMVLGRLTNLPMALQKRLLVDESKLSTV